MELELIRYTRTKGTAMDLQTVLTTSKTKSINREMPKWSCAA